MDYSSYFENAAQATRLLSSLNEKTIHAVLNSLAEKLLEHTGFILQENKKDLDRMDQANPNYDRLQLSTERIAAVAQDVVNVSNLPNPLGKILSEKNLSNGLHISKISVPLGVVGIIYEARPNVTIDVFSLCFKTGNVCVLKGGSDASFSNAALMQIIHEVLSLHGIPASAATLLPPEREATAALLAASAYVDVLIPRGSHALIQYVRQNSKVPVIETGAGIVHTFFDETAHLEKGKAIVANAKTRRVSVCNALDCLLLHENRLLHLPELLAPLAEKNVEIFADERSYAALVQSYPAHLLHPAHPEHFGTEFLSLKMSVKTVRNLEEALDHIARHSSKHSEAIVTELEENKHRFLQQVDAAAVYVNASTAFTDGAQFGLGAEIGISTQKLHARGPMGLEELTSYKWVIVGDGQTRA